MRAGYEPVKAIAKRLKRSEQMRTDGGIKVSHFPCEGILLGIELGQGLDQLHQLTFDLAASWIYCVPEMTNAGMKDVSGQSRRML